MYIRTLLGDIRPDELGFTNGHEHIVCVPPHWVENEVDDLLLDDPEKSKLDVLEFKATGGNSIIDATAIDYGRRVEEVAQISKDTGINIIGTAGFNKSFLWDAKIPNHLKKIVGDYETFYEWIEKSSFDKLFEIVSKEICEGLEGTPYKAGQVKFGTGYNSISPLEIKTCEVAVAVQKKFGIPLHSHTEAGTMALEQIELVEKFGGNLNKWSVGHMDRNLDFYYHEKIASHGLYLSFDGLGKTKYGPESARIDAIINLIKKGYTKQILLGGDNARKSYYHNYSYGLGLGWIQAKWLPRFKEELERQNLESDEIIHTIFYENPKRYLTVGM